MSKFDPNASALPTHVADRLSQYHELELILSGGFTKREMLVAMAMQGLLSCGIAGSHRMSKNIAKEAIEYADAVIEAINKEVNHE